MSKRERLIDLITSIPEHNVRKVYDQIFPILDENMDKNHEEITIVCCPHCGSVSIKRMEPIMVHNVLCAMTAIKLSLPQLILSFFTIVYQRICG